MAATTAGAAVTAPVTVCHALTATPRATTAKISSCTKTTTGGSGSISANGTGTGDVVHWANGGITTIAFGKTGVVKKDLCPTGFYEVHLVATVTGSTGPAAKISGPVSAFVCVPKNLKGKDSLLTGTVFKF
jgi:hypothetical protein